jgi:sterol desaturase/sphingolipid hydroxylase (fatty acid hydroxylase superfamily)
VANPAVITGFRAFQARLIEDLIKGPRRQKELRALGKSPVIIHLCHQGAALHLIFCLCFLQHLESFNASTLSALKSLPSRQGSVCLPQGKLASDAPRVPSDFTSFTMAFSNTTSSAYDLPPLPSYTLKPKPDLLPFISDFWATLLFPHVAYWLVSLIFHVIDIYDFFPHYRLHTPEEITQRNHVGRWECARDVILEQVIQVATSAVLSMTEPVQMTGMEDYDVAVWARRIRIAQRALPAALGFVGLNAASISKNMAAAHPFLAGALAGGHYPFLTTSLDGGLGEGRVPAFASWELGLAKLIYWFVIPAIQFGIAIIALDAWEYWVHRAMHLNKWMYSE